MLRPRWNIAQLPAAKHGGINYPELLKLGISPAEVLDFSVCTNPCGPPGGLKEALATTDWEHYPDSESTVLKTRLAEKLDVSTTNLIIGSGSTELFRLVATAYLAPGDAALVMQPTYGEYELASQTVGAQIIKLASREEDNFWIDPVEIIKMTRRHQPKCVFLCNPNNPTGQHLARRDIEQILEAAQDTLLILDEAYLAFTDNAWSAVDLVDKVNLLLVRSMTKDYALAGLRLGYGIAGEEIISILNKVKPPWNVNSYAQKAGIYVLDDEQYLERNRREIARAKAFLIESLQRLGLAVLPSRTNYFLVKVGDATSFRQALLKKGILVRDATSFGLPEHIRLGVKPKNECRRLIEAIKEMGG